MPKDSSRRNDTRRANKDRRARLEELRRQQKAAERRKNFIFIGSAIAIAIALIAAAVIPAYLHDRAANARKQPGYRAKPTAAEKAAGCLGVDNDLVSPAGQHVTTPIDYAKEKYGDKHGGTPPIPPSGGKHDPITLDDKNRFYSLAQKPRPERATHNMEHGYVDVWYDSKLPSDQVAALQLLAGQPNLSRLMVIGWWQGDLPAGKHVVLTSWGRTERCGKVSDTVINAFYKAHLNSPLAPEVGSGMSGPSTLPANLLVPPTSPSPSPSPSARSTASPSPSSTKK